MDWIHLTFSDLFCRCDLKKPTEVREIELSQSIDGLPFSWYRENTPNLDKSNSLGVAYLNSRGGLNSIAGLRKVSCQQDFRLVHCLRLVLTEECFADGRGLFRGVQIGGGIHLLQRLHSCAAKLGWGRQECVLRHLPDLSTPMRNQECSIVH